MYTNDLTDLEDWECISVTSVFIRDAADVLGFVCSDSLAGAWRRFLGGRSSLSCLAGMESPNSPSRHQNRDSVWFYQGRTEDFNVSSPGETSTARSMEGLIEWPPFVEAGQMIDRGEAGIVLLVDPQAAVIWEK